MRRPAVFAFTFAALAALTCLTSSAPAQAEKTAITTTMKGHDLEVVVHGVTDYCATDARTEVHRSGEAIRIVRARPHRVSRCFSKQDMTFVIADVTPGTYMVTYEQIPLVAPARPLRLAWTTTTVSE